MYADKMIVDSKIDQAERNRETLSSIANALKSLVNETEGPMASVESVNMSFNMRNGSARVEVRSRKTLFVDKMF